MIGGAAVIALLALVNIRGLGESAKLNIGLAILDLFTQVALVGLGAVLVHHPSVLVDQVHFGTAPSLSRLIFAVSISILAYTGIETVSNMAEEARDPGEQVPKAVNLVRCSNPGKAIVEEARERGPDLIYLSTEHAPSDERLLGPTTR
ncbi:MAG TPA: APC family permease [Solirubrobacterales bacterium]